MSSTAPKQLKRSTPFRVSADIPGKLERLAELNFTSATSLLELLIARAEGPIVRGEDDWHSGKFIARLRELAAQPEHARAEAVTSYSLGAVYLEGIRQLQNSLQLPRNGLVVEYLVRAAWHVEGNDDGGGGDELERRRRAGSRNLQLGRLARPVPPAHVAPLPGQLRLLEEDSTS